MQHKIKIDIEELIIALENKTVFSKFYLDKESGKIILISGFSKKSELDKEPDRFLYIQPLASHTNWEILNDFVRSELNRDDRETLERVLNGGKPFRSVKEVLLQIPEIRKEWFTYYGARMTRIAQDWLRDHRQSLRCIGTQSTFNIDLDIA